MSVRRQIYLGPEDEALLAEQQRVTGLSVSELVRRAIHQCYALPPTKPLPWDEVFNPPLVVGLAQTDEWVYDRLFDDEVDAAIDAALDAAEADRAG